MPPDKGNHISKPILKQKVNDDYKYQPLPAPTGQYPYHLDIDKVITIADPQKIIFHMVGDTGGIVKADFQQQVIDQMTAQYLEDDKPSFLYHLGDVVYNYGEEGHYYDQFFKPFEHYPGPIFAIPGNHDGDINPDEQYHHSSLYAFRKAFCDTKPNELKVAAETGRKSMVQPNVYWTLCTPLVHIIGLYSNVTKYGIITAGQRNWFIAELEAAKVSGDTKATIVALHHSPYSADTNHASSEAMQNFLDGCFEEAGFKPDIVFSGHVHNYQRFSRRYPDGTNLPYIVAGGGGYADLHHVIHYDDPQYAPLFSRFEVDADLEKYSDTSHGYLKVTVEKTETEFYIRVEYFAVEENGDTKNVQANLFDVIKIMVKK